MLVSFTVFIDQIENGRKRQTIRADRKDGRVPKVGATLHLWERSRSPHRRKLGIAVCTSVRRIVLGDPTDWQHTYIDDVRIDPSAVWKLARADGFDTSYDMIEWFRSVHGLPFSGYIIQWDRLTPQHEVRV